MSLYFTQVDGACNFTYIKQFISFEEIHLKNNAEMIGDFCIRQSELVTKLGLVMDAYKFSQREELWLESETHAADHFQNFSPKDLIHEETFRDGDLVYQFRYYTPPSNRFKIEKSQH